MLVAAGQAVGAERFLMRVLVAVEPEQQTIQLAALARLTRVAAEVVVALAVQAVAAAQAAPVSSS
ncbi:MAG: hypothetical protein EB117_16230 [Betaproteobacteria bacterium]|nr:hypothetical protein [Betaproteobacteria bacterium]